MGKVAEEVAEALNLLWPMEAGVQLWRPLCSVPPNPNVWAQLIEGWDLKSILTLGHDRLS